MASERRRALSVVWDDQPELHEPVLAAAFTGWNDAGDAASDALGWLAGHYGARRFAYVDPEEHIDLQAVRPTVALVDGVAREIRWPAPQFSAAPTPPGSPDLVLLAGPEPSYQWRAFCDGVVDVADRLGVTSLITFGALLADVAHTRPTPVTGATTDPAVMRRLALQRSRYEGPTGIVGVLHDACRRAALESVSLWASVPHYAASPPNPPAVQALLSRFAALTRVPADVSELDGAATAWRRRVDEVVAGDDDLRAYVARLEEQAAAPASNEPDHTLPTGDTIAAQFEEYLREQGLE